MSEENKKELQAKELSPDDLGGVAGGYYHEEHDAKRLEIESLARRRDHIAVKLQSALQRARASGNTSEVERLQKECDRLLAYTDSIDLLSLVKVREGKTWDGVENFDVEGFRAFLDSFAI